MSEHQVLHRTVPTPDPEKWPGFKPIDWAPGYHVNREGVVISMKSRSKSPGGWVCAQQSRPNGTKIVGLSNNGTQEMVMVRTLVAGAFIPNPDPKNLRYVMPIDGDMTSTRADNLQWSEFDGRRLRKDRPNSKFTPDDIRTIRANLDGKTQAELAVEYGVTVLTIFNIINRKTWKEVV